MANLHDYYFRQRVTEQELDEGFEFLEDADRNQNVDAGMVGIMAGLDVAEDSGGASLNVEISTGTAYSKDGERIRVTGIQTQDISVDEDSISTEPTLPGNSLVITIFVGFTRALGDPRTDGNSATVYFNRFENYEVIVRRGAEAASPAPGGEEAFINANGVANDASAIRVCDIIRANGQTAIADADIFVYRREDAFAYVAGSLAVNAGTPEASDQALLQHIQDVVNGIIAVEYDPTTLPVPGAWSALAAAATVQEAIDGMVDDLSQTAAVMGASLIGYNVVATWQGAGAVTQATNDVAAAIEGIITDLGDDTGTDGASRIGFDATLSTGPDLVGLGSGNDVREGLFELDATKGSLGFDNAWLGQNEFADTVTTDGFLDVNGNVNFGGASWIKHDPAHAFSDADLLFNEHSVQYVNAAALQTDDVTLYFNTNAAAGMIKGVAMVWTDNVNDSFIASEFTVPFTKNASSTPAIEANDWFVDIQGANVLQGSSPTSVSLSIEVSSNTISLRTTHNAGPTTRNLMLRWWVLDANLNQ